jgi:C4-dicarboxylate transporter/malic acid transport protein
MSAPLRRSSLFDNSNRFQANHQLSRPFSSLHCHPPHALGSPLYPPQIIESETPSGRPSSDSDSSHLNDIEKGLPIHTIPSLRLQGGDQTHTQYAENKEYEADCLEGKSVHGGDQNQPQPRLDFRSRLEHFTWAWYTLTMSTGGLSLLIYAQPHQFPGLRQIGLAVYIINLVLFVLVTSALVSRFCLFRGTFTRSLTHPREGFFFPTFFLSIATIITSTQRYCVPEDPVLAKELTGPLLWVIQVAFWLYVGVTTSVAVGQYSYVFSAHSFGLQSMMPTWILPIFPIMLSGTIASVIAGTQPPEFAVAITVAGLTCQGLGIAVAFMMYAHMVGRLMQSGLPNREHRTGLFMCVGPPAFTALAFIGMARGLPENFEHDMDGFWDARIIDTMGLVGAGFLWALSFWWFGIAVLAVVQSPPRHFHLGWWAVVFPNTGFTLATISLGSAFRSDTILWFSTAMSILLVLTYLFVLFHHVRAVIVQEIMYPGKDEDVEDH